MVGNLLKSKMKGRVIMISKEAPGILRMANMGLHQMMAGGGVESKISMFTIS